MTAYLGDYIEDSTLHFIWSTNNSTGASITRATDGEVRVYKDNGVSQSTAGVTDTEDFDGLTGIHSCTIDLSSDVFYATGSNYTVVLQGAIIDGKSVNAVLAHFSIENRRTETLVDRQVVYEDGAIWIDTVNGTSGADDFVNGTSRNPVDNITDANILSTSLGFHRFMLSPGSSITFAASQLSQVWNGPGAFINLGSQNVNLSTFHNAVIIGTGTGTAVFKECAFTAVSLAASSFFRCIFTGDVTLGTGTYHVIRCEPSGTTNIVFDFGGAVGDTTLNLRNWTGAVEIANLGQSGTDVLNFEGNGHVIFAASCNGGTVNLRGNINLTNNGSGITINQDARYELSRILSDETAFAGANIASILTDTDTTIPTLITALNNLSAAQVNTEVSDVLKTDTVTLPGQVTPPATPTLQEILAYLYKVWLHKKEQTASEWRVYDAAGSVIDHKAGHSSVAGVTTKQTIVSGP
jgi:hypothetical protein